jgi:two-component system NtrC family sensor kinase
LEDVDVMKPETDHIHPDNYARINNRSNGFSDLPISQCTQLQQVFLNLISNAIDAIGKEGLVAVKSGRSGQELQVRISDNGPGIPDDLQKKVFDPFFSTKEKGKGTGLGLWISYSIIEKMGGAIDLRSKPGEGTTFTVKLPIIIPEKK